MFWKYSKFRIENPKLTIIFMIVISLWWLFSWYILPKQYNPDIQMPAFVVSVNAPWFSSVEVDNLIVSKMEKKFKEIDWIDKIRWTSMDNFWSVMVTFLVWTDKEVATTRLYNKIFSSIDLKPYWVWDPIIMPIDPDEIPIYTFAIYNENSELNNEDNLISLKEISYDLIDSLKLIPNTTVFHNNWWYKKTLTVSVDLKELQWRNIDILQIYNSINNNNKNYYWWEIKYWRIISDVNIKGEIADINSIENIIIWSFEWTNIYLWDVANIYFWIPDISYSSFISSDWILRDAVFVWISKLPRANSIFVVNDIVSELEIISSKLPDWYKIIEIQNEWYTAQQATNLLIVSLFQAIFIVFVVLFFYLGFKDALNNSIAIPLTLAIVFWIALAIWDNVNRITLFATILVLWMLVDNSTVIVENISRHLNERFVKWKSKLEAITEAIDEVWFWVLLATLTRILAFVAMFFVTDMMWEYMWPIPKYAIIALTASFFIALSVNPFFAYFFASDNAKNSDKNSSKWTISDIDKIAKDWAHEIKQTWVEKNYLKIMKKLLDTDNKWIRKKFKRIFWSILFIVIFIPIFLQIFKAQMLPKSNQDQIYIWIDAPRDWSLDKSNQVVSDLNFFINNFSENSKLDSIPDNLKIIDNVSYWVWISPMPDFAWVFRWSFQRSMDSNISAKLNFVWKDYRNISSQDFVIKFRPILLQYLNDLYPELEIRVLEEPPGPPVQATFKLKVSWIPGSDYSEIWNFAQRLQSKIYPSLVNNEVVDIYNSYQTYQSTYSIKLDHQKVTRLWLDINQIWMWIYTHFDWLEVWIFHDMNTKYPIDILLNVNKDQINDINVFDKITFVSAYWNLVPLKEIADIIPWEKSQTIYNDEMLPTVYIYWEMAEDSVVYPFVALFSIFNDKNFWDWRFEVVSWNLYWFNIKDIQNWNEYYIQLAWEWKITMDTFADLWVAMIIALLWIYFIMVAQFKSFSLWWVIMITFLLWFFWVFPWFSVLYILNWEFFSATSMIWVIALAGIVVGNAIILIEYMNVLLNNWLTLKSAIIKAWLVRLRPIIITSLTTVLWVTTILWDPVWSWLALSIIFWLSVSAILTLIVIPVFLYDNLSKSYNK